MDLGTTPAPLFETPGFTVRELRQGEVPLLQALLEANPEYFLTINGVPPEPGQAQIEFSELPPQHLRYRRRWVAGIFDRRDGQLVGLIGLLSDFCVAGVWHLSMFLVATHLHGKGTASEVYAALDTWVGACGAQWLRLGVVQGNGRAERFWARCGFLEVRRREGVDTGGRINTLRVLVKPLAGLPVGDYLARVPRDQPGSTLP